MGFEFIETRDLSKADGAPRRPRRISPHNFAAGFAAFDVISLVFIGLVLAMYVRGSGQTPPFAPLDWQIWAVFFAAAFQFALARVFNVYRTKSILNLRHSMRRVSVSFLCTFAVMVVVAAAAKSAETYSRLWFFSWAVGSLLFVLIVRSIILKRVRTALHEHAYVYRALSVGVFADGLRPAEIEHRSGNEVFVVAQARFDELGSLADLAEHIIRDEIDQIYLAAPWSDIPNVMRNLGLLRHLSTRVFILPAERRSLSDIISVSKFGDRVSFCAMREPIHGWSLWFKRLEDIAFAGTALLLLSPLMLLTALLIRLDSPGPIFFRQQRVGFNGRTFGLWKFRSMYVEKTDHHAAVQTSRNDPRVTRVGRFIRRLSIDELPQLFNVIQGDMSIVGPRPHALSTRTEGRNLEELVDYYAVRHRVKPGMTGWAQINGFRGELDTLDKLRNRVDCDLHYIDNWTFWLDVRIIFKTIMIVLHDSSAY